MHTEQIVQVAGAALILAAFILGQTGRMTPQMVRYQLLNFVGSMILTFLAYHERQWGFLLLEATWAAVSLWALISLYRGAPVSGPSHP